MSYLDHLLGDDGVIHRPVYQPKQTIAEESFGQTPTPPNAKTQGLNSIRVKSETDGDFFRTSNDADVAEGGKFWKVIEFIAERRNSLNNPKVVSYLEDEIKSRLANGADPEKVVPLQEYLTRIQSASTATIVAQEILTKQRQGRLTRLNSIGTGVFDQIDQNSIESAVFQALWDTYLSAPVYPKDFTKEQKENGSLMDVMKTAKMMNEHYETLGFKWANLPPSDKASFESLVEFLERNVVECRYMRNQYAEDIKKKAKEDKKDALANAMVTSTKLSASAFLVPSPKSAKTNSDRIKQKKQVISDCDTAYVDIFGNIGFSASLYEAMVVYGELVGDILGLGDNSWCRSLEQVGLKKGHALACTIIIHEVMHFNKGDIWFSNSNQRILDEIPDRKRRGKIGNYASDFLNNARISLPRKVKMPDGSTIEIDGFPQLPFGMYSNEIRPDRKTPFLSTSSRFNVEDVYIYLNAVMNDKEAEQEMEQMEEEHGDEMENDQEMDSSSENAEGKGEKKDRQEQQQKQKQQGGESTEPNLDPEKPQDQGDSGDGEQGGEDQKPEDGQGQDGQGQDQGGEEGGEDDNQDGQGQGGSDGQKPEDKPEDGEDGKGQGQGGEEGEEGDNQDGQQPQNGQSQQGSDKSQQDQDGQGQDGQDGDDNFDLDEWKRKQEEMDRKEREEAKEKGQVDENGNGITDSEKTMQDEWEKTLEQAREESKNFGKTAEELEAERKAREEENERIRKELDEKARNEASKGGATPNEVKMNLSFNAKDSWEKLFELFFLKKKTEVETYARMHRDTIGALANRKGNEAVVVKAGTKLEEENKGNLKLVFILDQSGSMDFGGGNVQESIYRVIKKHERAIKDIFFVAFTDKFTIYRVSAINSQMPVEHLSKDRLESEFGFKLADLQGWVDSPVKEFPTLGRFLKHKMSGYTRISDGLVKFVAKLVNVREMKVALFSDDDLAWDENLTQVMHLLSLVKPAYHGKSIGIILDSERSVAKVQAKFEAYRDHPTADRKKVIAIMSQLMKFKSMMYVWK